MRALVTGASGFVGRHLIDHLESRGDDVVGTDRHTGVDILDEAAVRKAVGDARPEVVYHLAAWSDVGGSWSDPLAVFRVNAEGTLRVLQASAEHGVDRVVLVGSADVYGPVAEDELPLTEDSPLRPASPYAVSKAAADLLGLQAWLGHQLGVVRVRAFNHHGPGQTQPLRGRGPRRAGGPQRDSTGERWSPWATSSARRDFTDVRDVVAPTACSAEHGEPGEATTCARGAAVAIADIAESSAGAGDRFRCGSRPIPRCQRPVDVPVLLRRQLEAAERRPAGSRPSRSRPHCPTCSTTLASGCASTRPRPTAGRSPMTRSRPDHRHHRPGRLLPGRAPARARATRSSAWCGAAAR